MNFSFLVNYYLQNDHNPFLELTLATNKKISSVVKHLAEKWRDSFGATAGGIMLFPYNARSDNLVGVHRWTLNDIHITAADVYNMIGTPSVFRLRLEKTFSFGTFSFKTSKYSLYLEFGLKCIIPCNFGSSLIIHPPYDKLDGEVW